MNPLVNIAVEAVRAAGKIILKASERLDLVTIQVKSNFDMVTNVDHEAERKIIQVIHKAYPDHAILAEESGATGEHDITWIIDPLDGTKNFAHGFPHYCISIGIRVKQRLEHGVIYDPLRDELFVASKGRGAQLNGRKIRCRPQVDLAGVFLGMSHMDCASSIFQGKTLPIGGLRRSGSAALDMAYVAAGRLDAFLAQHLQVWDSAAGIVLIQEAGALVSDFSGREDGFEQGDVVAANPKLFKQLLQFIHQG